MAETLPQRKTGGILPLLAEHVLLHPYTPAQRQASRLQKPKNQSKSSIMDVRHSKCWKLRAKTECRRDYVQHKTCIPLPLEDASETDLQGIDRAAICNSALCTGNTLHCKRALSLWRLACCYEHLCISKRITKSLATYVSYLSLVTVPALIQ